MAKHLIKMKMEAHKESLAVMILTRKTWMIVRTQS